MRIPIPKQMAARIAILVLVSCRIDVDSSAAAQQ